MQSNGCHNSNLPFLELFSLLRDIYKTIRNMHYTQPCTIASKINGTPIGVYIYAQISKLHSILSLIKKIKKKKKKKLSHNFIIYLSRIT